MNKIIGHHLCFNGSYRSLESMAKIVNSTPGSTIKIPSTKYLIKKCMQPKFELEIHIKCRSCLNYLANSHSAARCELCDVPIKTTDSDYFVYISLAKQLENSLKNNIDEILSYNAYERQENVMRDIFDSNMFMQIKERYTGYIILPLTINTDGVKVFNCNQKSLWMIQGVQGWLPPSIRFYPTNVMIFAAHFGIKKPKMKDFFYPLLRELRKINDAGGIKISYGEKTYNFMPIIFNCCCDLPAKSDLQEMIGHTGYFGCGYCLHPALPVKGTNRVVPRYIKGSDDYVLRSHNDMIKTYTRLRNAPIKGVKSISCLVAANDFDLIYSFSIDYMHCALLGIVKKLLNLWLDSKNHNLPYYITKSHQIALSNRIVNIKPISEITRRPRSIFARGDYKANEYRSLLYYYLWFALDGLLPSKYVKHFRLLSSAIYGLSREEISLESIERARIQLNDFVNDFEILYGKSNVVMNLHLLKHITMQVHNLGPLWSQSAFPFEANNGIVTKSNTSTKDIVHQIMWKYSMKQRINPKMNDAEQIGNFTIGGKGVVDKKIIYRNVIVRGIKYTSQHSKEVSTIDFFVKLKGSNQIYAVKYYIFVDNILHAFVNTYAIIDTQEQFIQIERTDEFELVKMACISAKVLYMKFGSREFVVSMPNRYEKT